MDGILVCIALVIAIVSLRRHGHQEEPSACVAVHKVSDTDGASGASNSSLFDDEWPASSMQSSSFDTDWWTNPAYAFMAGNIYHNTFMDPTYTDWSSTSSSDDSCSSSFGDSLSNSDDWSSSTASFDDSLSSSSCDDSWSSGSFSDSFSSSSFND
ncbi:hypothetical protein SAMN04488503_3098 [Humidesulfovibrio mexicanus]|uniref:Uncharacterized protein n=2 Tax=Humidesulfovibrio mexicanus TaxID=147047 RepID=A0A239CGX3_9BACT|nr:hypothetical protein SAMN04488503_3098 [Humidesulfovibrio mexicanus]